MRILTKDAPLKVGEKINLKGWVHNRRDHGKLIFIDLRDRWGIVQTVFLPDKSNLLKEADKLRPEWVISVEGVVKQRPEKMRNPKIPTGDIEIEAQELKILGKSKPPPFPLDTSGYEIEEEKRLKYRYLDLRRQRLQKNIIFRSEFIKKTREFLYKNDFIEIETPILTKSTPEGSRDFVVPSRLHPGKFYALPQSPQQYKQLLMSAGFERYFQIARAVRDEDLRSDRGFEHTQIDIEMSFVEQSDVMQMVEELIIYICDSLSIKIKERSFPRFTYKQALEKFGADKFDLRSEKEKKENIHSFAWVIDFPFFEKDEDSPTGWTYTHNPFSDPVPEDKEKLLAGQIEGITTTQYDLICDGYEVAGGSIRSTDPKILQRVFEILGYKQGQIQDKFGHMLEAFSYGTPPHGGIAIGVERMLMTLLNEPYLREVQAFPMSSGGITAVMNAPTALDKQQLEELGLTVIEKDTKKDEEK